MPKCGRRVEKQDFDFLNTDRKVEKQEYAFMGENQVTSNGVHEAYAPQPYEPRNKRLAEKPNNMDPREMSGYRTSQMDKDSIHGDAYSITSSTSSKSTLKEQDNYNSHIHGRPTNFLKRPDSKNQIMNRYCRLPDIQKNKTKNISSTVFEPEPESGVGTPMSNQTERNTHIRQLEMQNDAYDDSNPPKDETIEIIRYELMKCLPGYKYIPDEPIKLTKDQERKLRRLVAHDLGKTIPREDLGPMILKDPYEQLAGEDKDMQGWCHLTDLVLTLQKYKIHLEDNLWRLLAARYVSHDHPACCNYEKIMSFLNLCLKQRRRSLESEDANMPSEPPTPDTNNETKKLVKLLNHQFKGSFYEFDPNKLVRDLMRARAENDCITENDMKDITFHNRLPIPRSLLERLLDRCEEKRPSDYRYNWKRFANIIQRALPTEDNQQQTRPTQRRASPLRLGGEDTTPHNVHDDFYTQPHNQHDKSPRHLGDSDQRIGYYDTHAQQPQQRQESPPRSRNHDMSPRGQQRYEQTQAVTGMPQRSQEEIRKQQIFEEIRKREMELQAKKERMSKEDYTPWFDRFMKLAKDLYAVDKDEKKTGYLPLETVRGCTMRHNKIQKLDLDDIMIDKCLDASKKKGYTLDIHDFLRNICNEKTKKTGFEGGSFPEHRNANAQRFNDSYRPTLQKNNYMTPRDTQRDEFKRNNMSEQGTWFNRFLRMADDLYKMDDDEDKVGFLPLREVRECCLRHNRLQQLNLNDAMIDNCLTKSSKGNYVDIDAFLKYLSNEKTKGGSVTMN